MLVRKAVSTFGRGGSDAVRLTRAANFSAVPLIILGLVGPALTDEKGSQIKRAKNQGGNDSHSSNWSRSTAIKASSLPIYHRSRSAAHGAWSTIFASSRDVRSRRRL
jgi:hypothetical protein